MKLKVAFYKKGNSIYSRLIRLWTKSIYSHTELVIQTKCKHKSYWITSDPAVGHVIVRESPNIDLDHWDFVEIKNVNSTNAEKIVKLVKEEIGKKYDYLGIFLSQIFPFEIQNPDKWFCSEIVSYLLKNSGIKDIEYILNYHPQYYNPGNLFDRLMEYYKKVNYDDR